MSVPVNVEYAVTLKNFLEAWTPAFETRLKKAMTSMLQFKIKKLTKELNTFKAKEDRYQGVFQEWVTKFRSEHFGGGQLFNVLDDYYPAFFQDHLQTEQMQSLLDQMTEKSKSSQSWAKTNCNNLKEILENGNKFLFGLDKYLNKIATVLVAFVNNWKKFANQYLNFIITGPAGSGKTELGRFMSEVFAYSGLVFRNQFEIRGRSAFIGKHIGASAPLTRSTLQSNLESVLFIDEAYSLALCNKFLHKTSDFPKVGDQVEVRTDENPRWRSATLGTVTRCQIQQEGRCLTHAQQGTGVYYCQEDTANRNDEVFHFEVHFADEGTSATRRVPRKNIRLPFNCSTWDTYGEEAVATMLQFLSSHRGQIVVIVAGYKVKVQESLLSINEGFARRFPFQWTLPRYTNEVLKKIFLLLWERNTGEQEMRFTSRADATLDSFLAENYIFRNQGGDMENLSLKLMRRVLANESCKEVTDTDVSITFNDYLKQNYQLNVVPRTRRRGGGRGGGRVSVSTWDPPSPKADQTREEKLSEILQDWGNVSAGLKIASRQMIAYKIRKLSEQVEELKKKPGSSMQTVLKSWKNTVATLLQGVAPQSQDIVNKFTFTNEDYYQILQKHYPKLFQDQVELERAESLLSAMRAKQHEGGNFDPKELKRILMRGLTDFKGLGHILNEIGTILITFSKNWGLYKKSFLNFMIMGPAGSGKTKLARFMGEVFAYSGILFRTDFRETGRANFIGQYVGQSAPLTESTLHDALESVLFIDEAYALATCDERDGPECARFDPYGQESISTMLDFLSTHRGQIVVILAGYEDKMQDLLKINEGVSRRFPEKWVIPPYDAQQLGEIFELMWKESTGRDVPKGVAPIIRSAATAGSFPGNAGDMENLVAEVSTYDTALDRDVFPCEVASLVVKFLQTRERRAPKSVRNLTECTLEQYKEVNQA